MNLPSKRRVWDNFVRGQWVEEYDMWYFGHDKRSLRHRMAVEIDDSGLYVRRATVDECRMMIASRVRERDEGRE